MTKLPIKISTGADAIPARISTGAEAVEAVEVDTLEGMPVRIVQDAHAYPLNIANLYPHAIMTEYVRVAMLAGQTRAQAEAPFADAVGYSRYGKTNLLLWSEDLTNAVWVKTGVTITANRPDPIGGNSATKWVETTAGSHALRQVNIIPQATCFSIYAKAGENNFIGLYNNRYGGKFFNLALGTVQGNLAAWSGTHFGIENIGGGWYRCFIASTNLTLSSNLEVYSSKNGSAWDYVGDGVSGIDIWRPLANKGASPLPYVKTTDEQVLENVFGFNNYASRGAQGNIGIFKLGSEARLYSSGIAGNLAKLENPRTSTSDYFRLEIECSEIPLDGVFKTIFDEEGGNPNRAFRCSVAGNRLHLILFPFGDTSSLPTLTANSALTVGFQSLGFEFDNGVVSLLVDGVSVPYTVSGGVIPAVMPYSPTEDWTIFSRGVAVAATQGFMKSLTLTYDSTTVRVTQSDMLNAVGDNSLVTATGQTLTLTRTSGVASDDTEIINEGLSFDGVDDYINMPQVLPDGNYTIICVANFDTVSDQTLLSSRDGVTPIRGQLDIRTAKLRMLMRDDADILVSTESTASVVVDTNHFIAGVRSGKTIKAHLNAVTAEATDALLSSISNGTANIGRRPHDGTVLLGGNLYVSLVLRQYAMTDAELSYMQTALQNLGILP